MELLAETYDVSCIMTECSTIVTKFSDTRDTISPRTTLSVHCRCDINGKRSDEDFAAVQCC